MKTGKGRFFRNKRLAFRMAACLSVWACSVPDASRSLVVTEAGAGEFLFGKFPVSSSPAYSVTVDSGFWPHRKAEEPEVRYMVRNKRGDTLILYYPDYLIFFYSPEYHTEKGFRPGMTVAQAMEVMGNKSYGVLAGGTGDSYHWVLYDSCFGFELDKRECRIPESMLSERIDPNVSARLSDFREEAVIHSVFIWNRN